MSFILGQHFMIGLSGLTLTSDEKKFIVENEICGVTLFGRNLKEPKQILDLCQEVQSLHRLTKNQIPLFIGVDMEGGRVRRLKAPFTDWPALAKLGQKDDIHISRQFAYSMGQELSAAGFNLDYAPCTDILTNPTNTAIGDRSIGSNPHLVAKHIPHLIDGYRAAHIITCSKHFPGHGNTVLDSHFDLPVENRSIDQLREEEFVAFKSAIAANVDMMMMAHIRYQKIDPEWPATLSEIFIQRILKSELGYQGLVVTDDLGMKAMSDFFGVNEIPVRALIAGNDLLLYCNEHEVPPIALQAVQRALQDRTISQTQIEHSNQRILKFKSKWFMKDRLTESNRSVNQLMEIVSNADHKNLVQSLI